MTKKILKSHYDYTIDTKSFDKNYINFTRDSNKTQYSIDGYLKTKKNHFKNLKKEYIQKVLLKNNKHLIK